jgi:hypothetical protein
MQPNFSAWSEPAETEAQRGQFGPFDLMVSVESPM